MSLLSIAHLRKAYGGVLALKDASLELRAGETLALMGENGAGKSTLIKILAGAVAPDNGEIRVEGAAASLRNPEEAHQRGLRFIHQELNVVASLSVAENIFLGRVYPRRLGLVDWRALNARAGVALAALGVEHVAPETIVSKLPVGDRMLVKIAAAFLEDDAARARIFVMDEPTAALTKEESERLFQMIAALRGRGCGILFVSHRLDEVLSVADRITVLRDGETCATLAAKDATKAGLIELMTGRKDISGERGPTAPRDAPIVLAVNGLAGEGLRDVSFALRKGEILGFTGLAGAGPERLIRALVTSNAAEAVTLEGAPVALRGPADAWARGIALTPRERRAEGLLLKRDVTRNVSLPHLERLSRLRWLVDRRKERARAVELGRRVRLKASGPYQKVSTLSGGNQQKVLLARAVAGAPRVLLLDEPTRGVDVAAKFDIYAFLQEITAAGASVVVVSSDHEELLRLCSRVAVLRDGKITATVPIEGLTPQRLLALCYGDPRD
ncbi:MAG TPA: sugar ABC transporter ATP-binding protein [Roseiarcus sp.]|nr:sugar ABC transporter ATP-binding protein [Roseiarcus sp.]